MEFSINIFFFQTSVNCKYFCRPNESFANKKVREHDKCFDYDAMQDAYIWLLFMFVMLNVQSNDNISFVKRNYRFRL